MQVSVKQNMKKKLHKKLVSALPVVSARAGLKRNGVLGNDLRREEYGQI